MSLEKTVNLTINNNSYTVNFPTIGQFNRIEALKQQFSDGQYGSMVSSGLKSQYEALENIDVLAHFNVLLPKEFFADLKIDSLSSLDAIDFIQLKKVYIENFKPWYDEWYKLFTKQDEKK